MPRKLLMCTLIGLASIASTVQAQTARRDSISESAKPDIDDAFGCPGYVYIPSARAQAERAGKKGEELDGLSQWGRSKCETDVLLIGLKSKTQLTMAFASATDFREAQRLVIELNEAQEADARIRRLTEKWIRPAATDAEKLNQSAAKVLVKMLSGDFEGAARAGFAAALAPAELGRGDFPAWYSPNQYKQDLARVQTLARLRNDVWELARRTHPMYR